MLIASALSGIPTVFALTVLKACKGCFFVTCPRVSSNANTGIPRTMRKNTSGIKKLTPPKEKNKYGALTIVPMPRAKLMTERKNFVFIFSKLIDLI
jgi:hypothetical protein